MEHLKGNLEHLIQGVKEGALTYPRALKQLEVLPTQQKIEAIKLAFPYLETTDKKQLDFVSHLIHRLDEQACHFAPLKDFIYEMLRHPHAHPRIRALMMLFGHHAISEEALPFLLTFLSDKDSSVRFWSLRSLGLWGPLAEVLSKCKDLAIADSNGGVRVEALNYMLKHYPRDPAVDTLLFQMLDHKCKGDALLGARELLLRAGEDPQLAEKVFPLLEKGQPILKEVLKDFKAILPSGFSAKKPVLTERLPEEQLFKSVLTWKSTDLALANRPLLRLIHGRGNDCVDRFIRYALANAPQALNHNFQILGQAAISTLFEVLLEGGSADHFYAIGEIHVEENILCEKIQALLESGKDGARKVAMRLLRTSTSLSPQTKLRLLLSIRDESLLQDVMEGLARLKTDAAEAVPFLKEKYQSHPGLRPKIIRALNDITCDPAEVLPLAWECLEDPSYVTVIFDPVSNAIKDYGEALMPGIPILARRVERGSMEALEALSNLGPLVQEQIPKLESLLESVSPEKQIPVAEALLKMAPNHHQALQCIHKGLRSNKSDLILDALDALGNLSEWDSRQDDSRSQIACAWKEAKLSTGTSGFSSDETLDLVVKQLHLKHPEINSSACWVLAKQGIREKRYILKKLETEFKPEKAIPYAVRIRIALPEALPFLIQAFADPEVGVSAGRLVERMGETAIKPLIEALQDPEEAICSKAARLLGTIGSKSPEIISALVQVGQDPRPRVLRAAKDGLRELRKRG